MSNMSLTPRDLAAIKSIVDEAIDESKLQTAAGFAAVDARFERMDARFDAMDARFDRLEDRVDRMALIQTAEVARADRQGKSIARLNRELGLQ